MSVDKSIKNILILPGDGIGGEVTQEAVKILQFIASNFNIQFNIDYAHIGGIAIDKLGEPLPQETIDKAKKSDAILLGAVGGPQWEHLDIANRPEKGLLGIRKELGLFANLRPAIVFDALIEASTLKEDVIKGLDIMIIRELTGGIYFGEPRAIEELPDCSGRRGYNTLVYTSEEIRRIARVAFDMASKRGGRLCSVDKANVLISTELWRQEITKIGREEYPEIELSHMYVDNAAMQIIRNPKQFDVVVTTNMFGDILSDAAAMLTGSLGMLPSASLGLRHKEGEDNANGDAASNSCNALYEPVHGSAPDIAGQNLANPLATILSMGMMLKYSFNLEEIATKLNKAVQNTLQNGKRTGDIMSKDCTQIGTKEMGDEVIRELEKLC